MTAVDNVARFLERNWRTVRDTPSQQYALRAGLGGLGLLTLAAAVSFSDVGTLVVGIIGLIGVAVMVVSPRVVGPIVVLAAAVIAWIIRYEAHGSPPLARTVALGALLYLTYSTATLAASIPVTARIDSTVLPRWYAHVAITLIVFGALAAIVYGIGEAPGSIPLELAGIVAVVILIAVPVWLARIRR
jgi:hypothetical protein